MLKSFPALYWPHRGSRVDSLAFLVKIMFPEALPVLAPCYTCSSVSESAGIRICCTTVYLTLALHRSVPREVVERQLRRAFYSPSMWGGYLMHGAGPHGGVQVSHLGCCFVRCVRVCVLCMVLRCPVLVSGALTTARCY
jgi:hypothetical protein